MIYISELQEKIVIALRDHPGSSYIETVELSGIAQGGFDRQIKRLMNKGIVQREGRKRHYKLYLLDVPYTVTEGGLKPRGAHVPLDDPNLLSAASIQLTDDQLLYLKGHKHLPRSVLAKNLGLSKLELNFAMDKMR